MSSPAQLLYAPSVTNKVCEEISLIPWTEVFISATFTIFFFVILQRLVPGTGILAFILTGIILCWYIVCILVAVYRDYTFWADHKPNYRVFARCSLNKEYNDRLGLKLVVLNVLSQKFVSCMLAMDFGALSIKAFRFFMTLVKLFMLPVLVARGVASLGASVGMGWAFLYMFIFTGISTHASAKLQLNPGLLWTGAAETMKTGSDEAQDGASAIMTAAEGAMIESGEDVPSGSVGERAATIDMSAEKKEEGAEGDNNEPVAPSPRSEADPHAKLKFFAEYADKSTLIPRIIFIICYSISCYSCIISWDWRYNKNGISYSQAWSAFDVYRPTAQTLYDNSDKLTNEQAAYIASTWS